MNLPVMSYGKTPEQVEEFYREVKRGFAAMPGVEHVPRGSWPVARRTREEHQLHLCGAGRRRADGQDFRAKFRSVSPGFFATFGVPILEGRDFNDGDKDGSERVVIISQSLRRNFLLIVLMFVFCSLLLQPNPPT